MNYPLQEFKKKKIVLQMNTGNVTILLSGIEDPNLHNHSQHL